jgi:hypothetical protein
MPGDYAKGGMEEMGRGLRFALILAVVVVVLVLLVGCGTIP